MPNPTSIHETVPANVPFCYQTFLQFCPEHHFPVTGAEEQARKVYFTLPGYKTVFEALFEPAGSNTYLTLTYTDRLNFIPVLTNEVMEAFIAKVNGLHAAEAQALLADTSPNEVLHLSQAVPPEVEKLLADLRDGPSAYGRRDTAHALGLLAESNERITAALVLARETDAHDAVRSEAAAMLQKPIHQAVLARDPAWEAKVMALTHVRQVVTVQKEQQVRQKSRSANGTITTGVILCVMGGAALILPLTGHYLTYLGLSLKDPVWGALILVIGLGVLGLGLRNKRSQ